MKPVRFLTVLIITVLIAACVPTATPAPATFTPAPSPTPVLAEGTEGFAWWNDTVFYEIFVRSFRDSNGDGIGDFNGITEKLDYLQGLGVRGLWLMPINPSPSYHGYDVTDYYAVNPDYGTLDDFKNLLTEAHKRGIRVTIDLVLNHTSDQHPWFREALKGNPEYKDWYVWSQTDPGITGPWGQKVWYLGSNKEYYYAVFWSGMPDLNYNNPAVRAEAKKMAAFWLADVGVDGFRLDAVRYLVEDGKILADSPANHAYFEEWGQAYRAINPQAFTVGEIWTGNSTVAKYTRTNTELAAAFNFDLAEGMINAAKDGDTTTLKFYLVDTVRYFPEQDNANFLTNHDQARTMTEFSIGDGIGKNKSAAAVLFTAPGIPYIYYGEEIGMTGNKPDERIRTPMQWSADKGAGFTEGIAWEMINNDFKTVNVAAQVNQPNSLLEHYRKLIQLRNTHPALRVGQTAVVNTGSKDLIAYLRVSADEKILIVVNFDAKPVSAYSLLLEEGPLSGEYTTSSLWDSATIAPLTANAAGGFENYLPLAEIPAYGVVIVKLDSK
jgi:glycosidase